MDQLFCKSLRRDLNELYGFSKGTTWYICALHFIGEIETLKGRGDEIGKLTPVHSANLTDKMRFPRKYITRHIETILYAWN